VGNSAPPLAANDLELRASPRLLATDWLGRPRLGLLVVVSFVAVAYSVARDPGLDGWALAIGICAAALVIPSLGARLRVRLVIRSGVVEYRGLLGRTHRAPEANICRAVKVRIDVVGPRFPFTRLLLLDANNHARLSIQEEWWNASDLVHFQQPLGLQLAGSASSLTARRANQLYPGAASFALRHRFFILPSAVAVGVVAVAEILRYVHPNSG
jgi:hypothetical protein